MTPSDVRRLDRLTLALVALVVLSAVLVVHALRPARPACTHGVSSVGPVSLVAGKPVGSTTPHTDACLP